MVFTSQLELEGLTPSQVYTMAVDSGLPSVDAAILVSSWIFELFGKTKRTFNYAQAFPSVDAACVSTFARTFVHDDWTDGESVVQAEQTVGEEGFNERFHRIEEDLDALGADVAMVFTCLANMRQDLRNLLNEIRTEINRVNADIFECCVQDTGPGGGIVSPVGGFAGLVDTGMFLGTTKFAEKNVSLWKTNQGIMMLPAVFTIGSEAITDPRITYPATLARYIEENPRVREVFGRQGVSKEEFIRQFGNDLADGGISVRTLVEILPANTRFGSLDDMLASVAERQAAAIRTTSGAPAAIAEAFGLETDVETVAGASIDRFSAIPSKVRGALILNGIDTMEQLADLAPREMMEIVRGAGVEIGAGEAASWSMAARTLMMTR